MTPKEHKHEFCVNAECECGIDLKTLIQQQHRTIAGLEKRVEECDNCERLRDAIDNNLRDIRTLKCDQANLQRENDALKQQLADSESVRETLRNTYNECYRRLSEANERTREIVSGWLACNCSVAEWAATSGKQAESVKHDAGCSFYTNWRVEMREQLLKE